ncbi:MAG: gamma-glutamylcyclotransferase [Pseudomonadales bacterium]
MTDRRIDGFFYGLFMDSTILRKSEVVAVDPRRAYVDDYALRIGRRATLIPTSGARAYGMIFALTHDELEKLYTAPGLEEYRPEAILAQTLEGGTLPALCYNLREAPRPDEANPEYAARLRETLRKLDFPPDYVASVS